MSRWLTVALSAVALAALGAGVAIAHSHSDSHQSAQDTVNTKPKLTNDRGNSKYLSGVMSGRWELDESGNPVQGTVARGSVILHSVAPDTLCYGITVKDIGADDAPTVAHIHKGKVNENGEIVVELGDVSQMQNPGAIGGCVDVDPAVWKRLQRAPVNYYVNVHTKKFPKGALRGNLAWTRYFVPVPAR